MHIVAFYRPCMQKKTPRDKSKSKDKKYIGFFFWWMRREKEKYNN